MDDDGSLNERVVCRIDRHFSGSRLLASAAANEPPPAAGAATTDNEAHGSKNRNSRSQVQTWDRPILVVIVSVADSFDSSQFRSSDEVDDGALARANVGGCGCPVRGDSRGAEGRSNIGDFGAELCANTLDRGGHRRVRFNAVHIGVLDEKILGVTLREGSLWLGLQAGFDTVEELLPSAEGYLGALTQEHPHEDVVFIAHSTPATRVLQGWLFIIRLCEAASRGATTGGGCIARFHVNRATFIVRFRDQSSRGEGFVVRGHSNDRGVDAVRGVAVG